MSNHLISEAYKRQLGSMARNAVMVLLADKASDDGTGIWASKQRMAEELGTTKQTVITTIKALVADGLLSEAGQRKCANGYTVEYQINVSALQALPLVASHQSNSVTGQAARPVKPHKLTGQAARPKPSGTPHNGLANAKPSARGQLAKPDDVSEVVWRDFKRQRKKSITDTALRGIKREAAKAGWSLEAALEEATTRGWESFKADWVKDRANGQFRNGNTPARDLGMQLAERRQRSAGDSLVDLLPSPRAAGGYG